MTPRRKRGRPAHDDVLTPAEWRTADAIRHGMRNREIATRRGVGVDAIKYHIKNMLAKLSLANRGALRLWTGVPRDSALAQRENDMTTTPALGPIGQIARSVKDIDASVAWYRNVLGLPHLFTVGDLAFFDCGGTRLMLSAGETLQAHESILYLRTADIHASWETLGEHGVDRVSAPHRIHRHADGTEEWMAFFRDLEGRTLALMTQVRPAP
jgi:DNA-binding CsgD family transcriptional regulator/catechol 2,3-dioxygenase-like lactoylglutathione lyase family enzyme